MEHISKLTVSEMTTSAASEPANVEALLEESNGEFVSKLASTEAIASKPASHAEKTVSDPLEPLIKEETAESTTVESTTETDNVRRGKSGNSGNSKVIDVPALLARVDEIGGKAAAIEYGITHNAIGGYRRAARIKMGLIKSHGKSQSATTATVSPTVDNEAECVNDNPSAMFSDPPGTTSPVGSNPDVEVGVEEARIETGLEAGPIPWQFEKSLLEKKIVQLTNQVQKLKAVIHELANAF